MGNRGKIASWTSWIIHVVLKQVHNQVKYDAFGVMCCDTHISQPEIWISPLRSSQGPCESADIDHVAILELCPLQSD